MQSAIHSIEVENLCHRYGPLRAIADVSFQILDGEIVGFLGPNGAGKSTTMRILTGLLQADSGHATVLGHSVAANPEAIRRLIGYMPENNPLPADLRVREYLRLRGRLKGLGGGGLRRAIERASEICDLDRKTLRKPIRALSKGYRQRVGIADTLLTEPRIIVLDEPTIGLDPHQIRAFRSLITSLRGRHTVIISSHILPEIEKICDRCIIINRGQLVASGRPSELRNTFLPGSSYEIFTADSVAACRSVLEAVDERFQVEDSSDTGENDTRRILASHPEASNLVPAILEAASQAEPQLRILGISRIEASLEDIFLAATRREASVDERLESAA